MRFGRFWYEIGPRGNREYYMFESQGARDAHIEERIAKDPHLADTIGSVLVTTTSRRWISMHSNLTFSRKLSML
jgi:hypothetical protein